MSPNPTNPSQQPGPQAVTEAEARRELEQVKGAYRTEVRRTVEHFKFLARSAKERLAYAAKEREDYVALAAKLRPHRGRPQQARDFYSVSLLASFYSAVGQALQVEMACYERNLATLNGIQILPDVLEVPEMPPLQAPEQDPSYAVAQATSNIAMAAYFWEEYVEGLDLVFRAAGQEGTVLIETPDQQALYADRAAPVADAAKGKPALGMLVQQIASELADLPSLLPWAEEQLDEAKRMAPADLAPLMADPRWGKIARKAAFLGGLAERAAAQPELAAHFPHHGAATMPFGPPTPPGTAQLTR
ncbi:MAG: hypothetical protein JWM80_4259 [Cyanobacteria bacterium RYN_339]|nr:hypothetical protein [Cyanobacteria bacterium RYN_339]